MTYTVCSAEGCDRAVDRHRFCGGHEYRFRNGLDMTAPWGPPPIEERFWAKVERHGPDECWVWVGGAGPDGRYGFFFDGQRVVRSHRWAFERWVQALEPGQVVMHTCDNDKCVNVAHLRAGTQLENIADMKAKGRARARKGEANGFARLTNAQAEEIRRRKADGVTQRALALEFGVGQSTVSRIVRGERYVSSGAGS